MDVSRQQLKRYQEVVALWARKYNTYEIGRMLDLPESLVWRWVVNFREVMREAAIPTTMT